MHVPSVVGANMTLLAEDGNKSPRRAQGAVEVFLAAGKTYDVTISPVAARRNLRSATPTPVFDRAARACRPTTSATAACRRTSRSAAAVTGVGTAASAATLNAGTAKSYYCVAGTPLDVSDPGPGRARRHDGRQRCACSPASSRPVGADTLSLRAERDVQLHASSPTSGTCGGTFTFIVNGATPATATIAQCDASTPGCAALGGAPIGRQRQLHQQRSPRGSRSACPGVLAQRHRSCRVAADGGHRQHRHLRQRAAQPRRLVHRHGGHRARPCSFTYKAVNSQKTASASAGHGHRDLPDPDRPRRQRSTDSQDRQLAGQRLPLDHRGGPHLLDRSEVPGQLDRPRPCGRPRARRCRWRASATTSTPPTCRWWRRAASAPSRARPARRLLGADDGLRHRQRRRAARMVGQQKVAVLPGAGLPRPEQALLHLGAARRRREPD